MIILELAICCSNNCRFTANCKIWKSSCLLAIWEVISATAKRLTACVNCNSFSLISCTWSYIVQSFSLISCTWSYVFNWLVKSFCKSSNLPLQFVFHKMSLGYLAHNFSCNANCKYLKNHVEKCMCGSR